MTVSGVRPAGPSPMRMSAKAVGEMSSGIVGVGARSFVMNYLGCAGGITKILF